MRGYSRQPISKDVFDLRTTTLRRSITLYAILWMSEGALRRWVLPGLSDYLLLVRDPLVIVIYFLAAKQGLFKVGAVELLAYVVVTLAFIATILVGHQNAIVAIFGARTMILHLPLIYVMGRALDQSYVIWLAKWIAILTVPMTILLIVQFYSPQSALVNVGLGGEGSAGFAGALDRFRPPGTFSFITGPICFYPLALASTILVFEHRQLNRWLLVSAIAAVLIACPVSISRSLVLSTAIVGLVGIACLIRGGNLSLRMIAKIAIPGLLASAAIVQLPVVDDSLAAFAQRWENSTTENGGVSVAIIDRATSALTEPIENILSVRAFGEGLGWGTNVGSKFLVGEVRFLAGESEWERTVIEMGPLLGLAFIGIRLAIFLSLFKYSYAAWKQRNTAPMLLLSVCGIHVVQGEWGQPTVLGFSIFVAGLVFAATKSLRPKASHP